MTLEELREKVQLAQMDEADILEESYKAYTHRNTILTCHKIMSERIKELEELVSDIDSHTKFDAEVSAKRIKELENELKEVRTIPKWGGDDNYCRECNAQDNINMLNGEYLCAECIEVGGLGE